MSVISDAIVELDDAAPTPGRDRREAIAVVFALCVAISSALFGRDDSVSIERTPPRLPLDPVSDRSGDVTTSALRSVSSIGVLDAVTYVYDSTGRVMLFVLDRNGQVIHLERGSVR